MRKKQTKNKTLPYLVCWRVRNREVRAVWRAVMIGNAAAAWSAPRREASRSVVWLTPIKVCAATAPPATRGKVSGFPPSRMPRLFWIIAYMMCRQTLRSWGAVGWEAGEEKNNPLRSWAVTREWCQQIRHDQDAQPRPRSETTDHD